MVSMSVLVSVCLSLCLRLCICLSFCLCVCIDLCVCMCLCIFVCLLPVHLNEYVIVNLTVYWYVCVCVSMCVDVCECGYACICVCVCVCVFLPQPKSLLPKNLNHNSTKPYKSYPNLNSTNRKFQTKLEPSQHEQVLEFLHVKPGKGSAFVRTKLKNLSNGGSLEKTFRGCFPFFVFLRRSYILVHFAFKFAGELVELWKTEMHESYYTYV